MSDISNLGSQLANASNAAQNKANVRPESPPPLTVQNAVAQTLNTPQAAVMQSPTAGNAEWRREANPKGRGRGPTRGEEDPTWEQVEAFVELLNQRLNYHHTHLQFEVVGDKTDWRIRIIDQNTRDLVHWISWEETWAFARSLEELEAQSTRGASGIGSGFLRVTA